MLILKIRVIVLTVLFGVAMRATASSTSTAAPATTRTDAAPAAVTAEATTSADATAVGEPRIISVRVVNRSDQPVTLIPTVRIWCAWVSKGNSFEFWPRNGPSSAWLTNPPVGQPDVVQIVLQIKVGPELPMLTVGSVSSRDPDYLMFIPGAVQLFRCQPMAWTLAAPGDYQFRTIVFRGSRAISISDWKTFEIKVGDQKAP